MLACIYIDLYGYTDRLTHIRSAGWQLDMYMFIYINGYPPICQHICHPEYTYRAYHIYIGREMCMAVVSVLLGAAVEVGMGSNPTFAK